MLGWKFMTGEYFDDVNHLNAMTIVINCRIRIFSNYYKYLKIIIIA